MGWPIFFVFQQILPVYTLLYYRCKKYHHSVSAEYCVPNGDIYYLIFIIFIWGNRLE